MTRFRKLRRALMALRRQLPSRGTRVARVAYRAALLLLAALVVDLAFPTRPTTDLPVVQEGNVAPEDIIASVSFPVYKTEAELSRARAEAANAVSPIFDHEPRFADSALVRVQGFFAEIEDTLSAGALTANRRNAVRAVLDRYRISVSPNQIDLLVSDRARARLREAAEWAFGTLLRSGVVPGGDLGAGTTGSMILRSEEDTVFVPRDSVTSMQAFYERAAERLPSELGVAGLQLFQNLAIRFAEPTIRLNREATDSARVQARQAVDRVEYEVLAGERIVAAHERVEAGEAERLRAYQERLAELGRSGEGGTPVGLRAGSLIFNLALLLVFGLVLKYFRPEVYDSMRSLTLLWVLVVAVAVAAGAIAGTGVAPQLIPVAFAALILAALFDGLLALTAVFVIVALVAGRPPLLGMTVLFSALLGGAAAALSGRVVRRRTQTWGFAAVIAVAYVLAAVTSGLLLQQQIGPIAESAMWGSVNAIGSTLLAMGILPLAESFTGITTDQTLLELADLNRPLLRRLSLEAPGTYAHSINVANLAEAAARGIGANSLLIRVGIYYHDIGKLKKPQYFVENQPRGANPHDKLKPATSANIVREHVKDGLALAEEAGLPDVVKAFITEHHGTQKIGFFYERAKELEPDGEHEIEDYRYSGPRPRGQETAIALLADSVESAARALQDPTPEKIEELVDRIVAGKMEDGQLDGAPLTLQEISTIKEQFVKVLTGMYHHRLDYPTAEEGDREEPERPVAPGIS